MTIEKLPPHRNEIYYTLSHFKFCSENQKDSIYQIINDSLLDKYGRDKIISALNSLREKCDLYPLPCYICRELEFKNPDRQGMLIERMPDFFNYTLHKINDMIEEKIKSGVCDD